MHKQTFDTRCRKKMDKFSEDLKGLDGTRRALVEDALYDYCRIAVLHDEVMDRLRDEGTRRENGAKNPDITTLHTLANEKNALLPRLLKYLEPTVTDDKSLDSFLENN